MLRTYVAMHTYICVNIGSYMKLATYRIVDYFRRGNISQISYILEFEGKFSRIFPHVLKLEISSHVALTSITLKKESYSIDSVIRGYHIYGQLQLGLFYAAKGKVLIPAKMIQL